jgi:hypothetical protein
MPEHLPRVRSDRLGRPTRGRVFTFLAHCSFAEHGFEMRARMQEHEKRPWLSTLALWTTPDCGQ